MKQRYIKKGSEEQCWPWIGGLYSNGYGQCGHERAHRVAYREHYGEIPPGLLIMHLCRNKVCCNPYHLKAGTPQENRAYEGHLGIAIKTNSSGIAGVSWNKHYERWAVQFKEKGVSYVLYWGKDFFEACCARKSWEAQQLTRNQGTIQF